MLREILIWPHPVLATVAEEIDVIDDDIKALAKDMLETMYDADGVGLAAPQVGVSKQLVVVDIHGSEDDRPSGEEPLILINPKFSQQEGSLEWEEGCLSVPGETGNVTRAAKVTMTYLDLDGVEHSIEAEGLKAVALQHECDHLNGKVFVEYLSRLKQKVIKRRMLKLKEERAAEREV